MEGNLPDISTMLQGILSDPEAAAKLMETAKGLMGSLPVEGSEMPPKEKPLPTAESAEAEPKLPHSPKRPGNGERMALLSALRPYLSPERRQTADTLMKVMQVMKLTDASKLLGK